MPPTLKKKKKKKTLFTFAEHVIWTKAVQFYDHLQNGFFTLKSLKQIVIRTLSSRKKKLLKTTV